MKKILLILCFIGFIIFSGIAGNPDNPPDSIQDGNQIHNPSTTVPDNNCVTALSVVDITVFINISDCPDYECAAKDNCYFHIYLYCNNTYIGNIDFDPKTCSYDDDFRASEGYYVYAVFVADNPPGCSYPFNNIPAPSTGVVPIGGGDVTINIQFCE